VKRRMVRREENRILENREITRIKNVNVDGIKDRLLYM
jgi:hypothetical protein